MNAEELTTSRLTMRRPTQADIGSIFAITADPRTTLHNPSDSIVTSRDALELYRRWNEQWGRYGFGYWVIRRIGSELTLGFCGVKVMPFAGAGHSTCSIGSRRQRGDTASPARRRRRRSTGRPRTHRSGRSWPGYGHRTSRRNGWPRKPAWSEPGISTATAMTASIGSTFAAGADSPLEAGSEPDRRGSKPSRRPLPARPCRGGSARCRPEPGQSRPDRIRT